MPSANPRHRAPLLRLGLLALGLLVAAACRRAPVEQRPLRVAAAADLQDAFGEVAALYQRETGRPVVLTFGASGVLARQVREGAPFDLLATASVSYIDDLERRGQLVPGSRAVFARGRLALWRPPGSGVTTLASLLQPAVQRVALANPDHAPYGAAAIAALQAAGLLPLLKGKLVYAENVRQALQFAESGNVDAALVARSLCAEVDPEGGSGPAEADSLAVVAPTRRRPGRCALVPAGLHAPIDQGLGVVRGGDEASAARFAALLRAGAGLAILRRHGFQVSGAAR